MNREIVKLQQTRLPIFVAIVSRLLARDVTVDLSLLRELYVRLVIVALAHFTEIHRFHSIRDYFVLRFDFSGWLVFGN